jgi:hypothetical protein
MAENDQPVASRAAWEYFIAAFLPMFALVAHGARKPFTPGADHRRRAHYVLIFDFPGNNLGIE